MARLAGSDGPDRLVGDHDPVRLLRPGLRQVLPNLGHYPVHGLAGLALLEALPDAQDGGHPVVEHRPDLLGHLGIGLSNVLPTLGVADDHVPDLERFQHRRGDLAGERPLLLPVDVLGPEGEPEAVAVDQRLHTTERGERRTDHHLDPFGVVPVEKVGQLLDVLDGLQMVLVHLPVRGHDRPAGVAHDRPSISTATPGKVLPSRNSSAAPPPVDRWSTASSKPSLRMAATLSPPPTTVNASAPATAWATPRVPRANGSSSNTPIGPFQNTVLASARTRVNSSTVRGPMSNPLRPGGIRSAGTVRCRASAEASSAATTSSGRRMGTPRSSAFFIDPRTASTCSSSTRESPVPPPWAARKVKAIAPPTSRASTRSRRASMTSSLSDTLAPPRTATNGSSGSWRSRDSTSTSCCINRPAAEGRRSATPTTEAWARWA